MTKSLSFLSVLFVFSLAAPARALPTNVLYTAALGGKYVGSMMFSFDSEVMGRCRYVASWDFGEGVPGEQCTVEETRSVGFGSCWLNAMRPVSSLVLDAIGEPCWGIDASGQSSSVFTLILNERASDGALDGVVQLDAATDAVSSFHAAPVSGARAPG